MVFHMSPVSLPPSPSIPPPLAMDRGSLPLVHVNLGVMIHSENFPVPDRST